MLVSTGRRIDSKKLNGRSDNVLFIDWVSGISAIQQSDLVIYHGGYGTTMEVLLFGKPSIIIPSHSEQEGNGLRLASLGVGKTILLHKPELKPLAFTWTYGSYQMLAGFEYAIHPDDILRETEAIFNQNITEKVNKVSHSLKEIENKTDFNKILDL